MKIKQEHYDYLKNAIDQLDKEKIAEHNALKLGKDKEKRFKWDLFNAAKLYNYASEVLYNYLNDNHIETALTKIVKELEL